jgi:hypothetical protein
LEPEEEKGIPAHNDAPFVLIKEEKELFSDPMNPQMIDMIGSDTVKEEKFVKVKEKDEEIPKEEVYAEDDDSDEGELSEEVHLKNREEMSSSDHVNENEIKHCHEEDESEIQSYSPKSKKRRTDLLEVSGGISAVGDFGLIDSIQSSPFQDHRSCIDNSFFSSAQRTLNFSSLDEDLQIPFCVDIDVEAEQFSSFEDPCSPKDPLENDPFYPNWNFDLYSCYDLYRHEQNSVCNGWWVHQENQERTLF